MYSQYTYHFILFVFLLPTAEWADIYEARVFITIHIQCALAYLNYRV